MDISMQSLHMKHKWPGFIFLNHEKITILSFLTCSILGSIVLHPGESDRVSSNQVQVQCVARAFHLALRQAVVVCINSFANDPTLDLHGKIMFQHHLRIK